MTRSSTRAAVMLWIVGGIQVLLSGCLGLAFAVASLMPPELRQQLPSDVTPEQAKRLMLVLTVLLMVLGLGPGIGYLVLGFGVRKGKSTSIHFALLLLFTQSIVLGTLLLFGSGQAIMQRRPDALTIGVLVFGTPLALLAVTIYRLLAHQRGELANLSEDSDPWNEPQP